MQAAAEADSESGEPTPEERLAEANDQLCAAWPSWKTPANALRATAVKR